jgi:hypothetical protein
MDAGPAQNSHVDHVSCEEGDTAPSRPKFKYLKKGEGTVKRVFASRFRKASQITKPHSNKVDIDAAVEKYASNAAGASTLPNTGRCNEPRRSAVASRARPEQQHPRSQASHRASSPCSSQQSGPAPGCNGYVAAVSPGAAFTHIDARHTRSDAVRRPPVLSCTASAILTWGT